MYAFELMANRVKVGSRISLARVVLLLNDEAPIPSLYAATYEHNQSTSFTQASHHRVTLSLLQFQILYTVSCHVRS